MRIAVLQSSDNLGLLSALEGVGMTPVVCALNAALPQDMAGYIIAGRPSDTGALLAAAEEGKPLLGMGEGVAVLLEMGLIPGLENNKPAMTLSEPAPAQAGWAHLRLANLYQRNAFTRHLTPATVLRLPVANLATRFVMSEVLLQEIEEQGLNVFQYCDEAGVLLPMNNIAAVANKAGNVMAMLPQLVGVEAGDLIFKSMHDYIKKGVFNRVAPLNYYPRRTS